jgi:carboxymethylenebutenolidase
MRDMAMTNESVQVDGLRAYVARPEAGATVGMLLLPMITGNGKQLRAYADSIAEVGVLALSWDPFHGPSGDDTSFEDLMKLGGQITDATALAEQKQWVDYLFGTLKLTKVGVIGWCMGGRLALVLAAREPRLATCVAYHATIRRPAPANHMEYAITLAAAIRCPVQAIYPGADEIVPAEVYGDLHKALAGRDAPTVAQYYPLAKHGFMDAARQGHEPNRAATQMAWPQTLAFIKATLA